jgi:hypothetical protein
MLFGLVIATSLTCDGDAAFCKLDKNVTNKIIYALEMLFCYWAWLKQNDYWGGYPYLCKPL